jgi:hypothetical protein
VPALQLLPPHRTSPLGHARKLAPVQASVERRPPVSSVRCPSAVQPAKSTADRQTLYAPSADTKTSPKMSLWGLGSRSDPLTPGKASGDGDLQRPRRLDVLGRPGTSWDVFG